MSMGLHRRRTASLRGHFRRNWLLHRRGRVRPTASSGCLLLPVELDFYVRLCHAHAVLLDHDLLEDCLLVALMRLLQAARHGQLVPSIRRLIHRLRVVASRGRVVAEYQRTLPIFVSHPLEVGPLRIRVGGRRPATVGEPALVSPLRLLDAAQEVEPSCCRWRVATGMTAEDVIGDAAGKVFHVRLTLGTHARARPNRWEGRAHRSRRMGVELGFLILAIVHSGHGTREFYLWK